VLLQPAITESVALAQLPPGRTIEEAAGAQKRAYGLAGSPRGLETYFQKGGESVTSFSRCGVESR